MENNLRDNFVDFIYTYQQEMPVKRITDGGYFSKQEINNFATTALFECYAYISRRLRIIAKALAEQKSKIEAESGQAEISDALEEYLLYTHEEDNGLLEEPTRYEDNFLGARCPNERKL